MNSYIRDIINESINVKRKLYESPEFINTIGQVVDACVATLTNGGKVLFCGNGGSAADAQHLAAELSGRFYYDRPPLSSEALHVNTSYLTAVANDYSYDEVYARLVKGSAKKGDILIGLSTSGNSKNIIKAFETARSMEVTTIALTGQTGGNLKEVTDLLINVPSEDTPRIQESHILIGHIICQLIESRIFPQ
ncbi:MAG TPA: phosphoheptose isomerase [Bacteroidales bacterium]|nr:MAG: phosphoheptose isomerase [Bacteroidetes bacterium GWE2_42_24]OFY30756.1 MAG: phosphoheptose isomerase [Bacteroidetes bacterium GWF2_43_11]PKP20762.1 MAG: phosphoheptose isomerase [Bacteroidetes bacterium HGW-Bacteroidetes-22]HBZ65347.1 phosphoheptose isomerase [Bacteroidales bacterium]